MQMKNQQAFTMLELTFVIVVIGILSAIALPRFAGTADTAYTAKAQSTLITVRNALATERQRRVLRGDFTGIVDLGLDASGNPSTNAFDHFSGDGQTPSVYAEIFRYPIANCGSSTSKACWDRVDATHYEYRFPDSGEAKFILQKNRLDCDSDATDCKEITG